MRPEKKEILSAAFSNFKSEVRANECIPSPMRKPRLREEISIAVAGQRLRSSGV
jgi:hypothetical protein